VNSEAHAPIGRLAPSPTGLLHLGHARTFLIAWWRARSTGGALLMRLEDLDGPRCTPAMAQAIVRDLAWLGLDWDGPSYVQSTGLVEINQAAERLAAQGLAYACVCSRGDIRSAQSAPQQGESEPRYPGTCRGKYGSVQAALAATGKPAGLRLLVADGPVAVTDQLVGERSFDVQKTVGDFLITKRDHAPAYQLAVVVDDARQRVTEVVRGNDLLESTARQRLLQQALGLPAVRYFHVPLVVDEAGRRLAKRHDDLSLAELRAGGTDPRAIVGWVARSCGLSCGERVTPGQALPAFSLAALPRQAVTLAATDIERLRGAR
jgi:glutamyl-tRNA synthetase